MRSKRFKTLASKLWTSRATISVKATSSDGVFDDVVNKTIAKDRPCKVVVKRLNPVDTSKGIGEASYTATLLIDTDIDIPAGSVIDVTDQNGHKVRYKQASNGFTSYSNHQEVSLIFNDKAKKGDY